MIKCSFIGISNIYEFKLEQIDEDDLRLIKESVLKNKHELAYHSMLPLLDTYLLQSLISADSHYFNFLISIDPVAFADSLESLANSEYGKTFYIVLNDVNIYNVYLNEQAIRCFSFYYSRIENLTCEIYSLDDVYELKRALHESSIGKLTIILHGDFSSDIKEIFNDFNVDEVVVESI
jgi:hypothetical protein